MARYFVHLPPDGSAPIFWRAGGDFAGEIFHYNLSLLALAAGDDPNVLLPAGDLVPKVVRFRFGPNRLQPFAYTPPGGSANEPVGLPIAKTNFEKFLNDPLGGERMNLSLPFYDEEMKLGPTGGGWMRKDNSEKAFHGGSDFVRSPRAVFDVCAAANGKVAAKPDANGNAGAPLVLSHFTSTGKEFRTIYQHLDIDSVPSGIKDGADVRRGQFIGSTIGKLGKPPPPATHTIHLHFGVAVKHEGFILDGKKVPELWYFIDPSGVYDYYEHDDVSNVNYLPPESQPAIFKSLIAGSVHTVQWQSQPLFKTIPIARSTAEYAKITRFQVRARRREDIGGTLPAEHEQLAVWLSGDSDFFLVPLAQARDRATEIELTALLRDAFFNGKRVRLEYRYVGDLRYIMAAWVNR